MLDLVAKDSIKGIKGTLWNDDFLAISSYRECGVRYRDIDSFDGEEWFSFSENWSIADIKRAVLYYLINRIQLDKKLDSLKGDILEGYEATKSEKLSGYSTFNAISLFWDIDVHWVALFFVRKYIREPCTVKFNFDRWSNLIYVRLGR